MGKKGVWMLGKRVGGERAGHLQKVGKICSDCWRELKSEVATDAQ